jgi:hypothetical protein
MRILRQLRPLVVIGLVMFLTSIASAAMVLQMNLNDLASNADKIIRGTVLGMQLGTVEAGGAELPMITYRIRIRDDLKSTAGSGGSYGGHVVTISMLGSVKGPSGQGGVQYVGGFKPELIDVGQEYLLFTTRPSSIGLSTMVGLSQGAFKIMTIDKEDYVVNGLNNQGLFRGMDRGSFPDSGPISYSNLSARIRIELTN